MTKILCIETSEKKCSVALSYDGLCKEYKEECEDQSHARLLTIMIQELMLNHQIAFSDLDAVCVASGPGSYTGLRIGVSTAKGLCWASDIKLLSLSTTEILAEQAKQNTNQSYDLYLATLDARRNEVYIGVFDESTIVEETQALILDENPLAKYEDKKLCIVGSGASKFEAFLKSGDSIDSEIVPNAKSMCGLAFEKFNAQAFEDLAYFEPKYIKAVHTTVSTKKIFA